MAELIQLIYASRATFEPAQGGGIDPNIARILTLSRRNNPKLGLGGVLYYGDGYFFQCLEGDKNTVERIYADIENDPRHAQIKLLERRPVEHRHFPTWSMKYVPVQEDIKELLNSRGFSTFNPFSFDQAMIDAVLGILTRASDPTRGKTDVPSGWLSRFNDRQLALAASGLSLLALLLAVIALFAN